MVNMLKVQSSVITIIIEYTFSSFTSLLYYIFNPNEYNLDPQSHTIQVVVNT